MTRRRGKYKEAFGSCRLCKAESKLCHSHIIPEFLYSDLYDENHRIFEMGSHAEGVQFKQKGEREYLLCKPCEVRLSVYENYAEKVLNSDCGVPREMLGGLIFEDNDYAQLKLFQLSLLWRCAIASSQHYISVKLTETDLERLRCMLLTGDPGKAEEFGCVLVFGRPRLSSNPVSQIPRDDVIMVNGSLSPQGKGFVTITAGGIHWVFQVPKLSWLSVGLHESGRLPLIRSDTFSDKELGRFVKPFVENMRRIKQAQRTNVKKDTSKKK